MASEPGAESGDGGGAAAERASDLSVSGSRDQACGDGHEQLGTFEEVAHAEGALGAGFPATPAAEPRDGATVTSAVVGVDLEAVALRRDPKKLANKFFSSEESDWLAAQPVDHFFMLWVLKEAYVKAIGRSIFGGINRLRCRVLPPDIEVIGMDDRMHNLCLFSAGEVYLALASTEESLSDVAISKWDFGTDQFLANDEFSLLATSGELAE